MNWSTITPDGLRARSVLSGQTSVFHGPVPRPLRRSVDAVAPVAHGVAYVYVMDGPMGCIYIGQTSNPGHRMVQHRKRRAFWRFVTHLSIYRHGYAGMWPNIGDEVTDLERLAISDLVPIFNLDRTLSEADRGAPWEGALKARNRAASMRAVRLLGK